MIRSRPSIVPDSLQVGSGIYTLNMTYEEIELISAFLYITRLGQHGYPAVAGNISKMISDLFNDQDFSMNAYDKIDMGFQVMHPQTLAPISFHGKDELEIVV